MQSMGRPFLSASVTALRPAMTALSWAFGSDVNSLGTADTSKNCQKNCVPPAARNKCSSIRSIIPYFVGISHTFFLRKKESMQRKTFTLRATGWWQDKGRNEGLALRAIAFGRNGSQREGRPLRTFFLRKKESTQRKTLTFRATGRQQDEIRKEGRSLTLRAIARARQGGTFGCGQRRNGVQWRKEKIPCDDRGKGGKNDA